MKETNVKKHTHTKHEPMEFVAKMDPKAKPGAWKGRYVAKDTPKQTAKQTKAAKTLQKFNAPIDPASYVN